MTKQEFLEKLIFLPDSTKFNKQNIVSYMNILRELHTDEYNKFSLFVFENKLRMELELIEKQARL